MWTTGIGVVLGTQHRRRLQHSGLRDGSVLANAAIVVGVVGLVLAALFWSAVAGIGGANVDTSSLSFVDRSNFASANYATATSESSPYARSNAHSYDNPRQWMGVSRRLLHYEAVIDLHGNARTQRVVPH